jgi:hypothetical protein
VEVRFSLCRDVIGWRQSPTTGNTLREQVIVREFAPANNGILAGAAPEMDTTNTENDTEMKTEAEDVDMHRMARVHGCLEMCLGSQNLGATQKESPAQYNRMITMGYSSVKATWSLFQHDGAAAFKLSERTPLKPPLSATYLPGGRTHILNVHHISRINHHLIESDDHTTPQSISDTDEWLNWNADLDNPNDRDDDCVGEVESDMEQDNRI